MDTKRDIGQVFKQKLSGIQRSPGDAVWASITAELGEGNQKKKFVPAWFTKTTIIISAIVASLLIAIPCFTNNDTSVPAAQPAENTATGNRETKSLNQQNGQEGIITTGAKNSDGDVIFNNAQGRDNRNPDFKNENNTSDLNNTLPESERYNTYKFGSKNSGSNVSSGNEKLYDRGTLPKARKRGNSQKTGGNGPSVKKPVEVKATAAPVEKLPAIENTIGEPTPLQP